MEPVIPCDPRFTSVLPGNVDGVSELEGFGRCVDQLFSKVDELEQQVNVVEQFYVAAGNKQLNVAKGGLNLKDKVQDDQLVTSRKQQQDALQGQAAGGKKSQELMCQFAAIFDQVTQHKWAEPFMEPVDVVGLGLDDYYKVIEKPMDFGTIKNRMESKDGTGYKNVREIYADVRLVFKNAMKYNDERHDYHVMAKTLLEKFQEKWLQLLPKVVEEEERRGEDEAASQLAAKVAEEVSHANLATGLQDELRAVDLHLEKLREMVVQKCRKISTEEKKRLVTALSQLSVEDLNRALEIVAENNPSFHATAEEVDLDIDAQSESTLWRLKVFVQDALKGMGRNSKGVAGKNLNCNDENKNVNINTRKSKKASSTMTSTKNNSKRKREICDALTKTPSKKTKKISLIL